MHGLKCSVRPGKFQSVLARIYNTDSSIPRRSFLDDRLWLKSPTEILVPSIQVQFCR